jgi:hypothetical protein
MEIHRGCGTSRFPHVLDNRLTDGGEVVSLTRRPPFTPRKIPGTLTSSGIEPATFRLVTVSQTTTLPRAPYVNKTYDLLCVHNFSFHSKLFLPFPFFVVSSLLCLFLFKIRRYDSVM